MDNIPQEAPNRSSDESTSSPRRLTVFGVGGAGGRVVQRFCPAQGLSEDVRRVILDTDGVAGQADGIVEQIIPLGRNLTRGLSAGGDPEVGRQAAEADQELIAGGCAAASVVFVVSGLGGGTGTGASPVVARLAKEQGAFVVAMVFLPFDCEGSRRSRQAREGIESLKDTADVVLCLPSQPLLQLVGEESSLVETFAFSDGMMVRGLQAVWRLISEPGLITVDFAHLREVVQGSRVESRFAFAEAEGPQRVSEVAEKLLGDPMLDQGALLHRADSVLVSIAAGPGLTVAEMNRLMERIGGACEQGEVLLGATIDPRLEDRLVVTLIAAAEPLEPLVSSRSASGDYSRRSESTAGSSSVALEGAGFDTEFFEKPSTPAQRSSKFVPPPPVLTSEQREKLWVKHGRRSRAIRPKLQQGILPLEIVSKGRFEKIEPTLYRGEDLDIPTYVRRGLALS